MPAIVGTSRSPIVSGDDRLRQELAVQHRSSARIRASSDHSGLAAHDTERCEDMCLSLSSLPSVVVGVIRFERHRHRELRTCDTAAGVGCNEGNPVVHHL